MKNKTKTKIHICELCSREQIKPMYDGYCEECENRKWICLREEGAEMVAEDNKKRAEDNKKREKQAILDSLILRIPELIDLLNLFKKPS